VLIDRILGTPDEDNWPGVTSLPDYKTTFPQWAGVPLPSHIRGLDADGLELLTSMLIYDPAHRMSGEFFVLLYCLPRLLLSQLIPLVLLSSSGKGSRGVRDEDLDSERLESDGKEKMGDTG
jgi:hypothetical protein